MARIFLSHSSQNNTEAAVLKDWLNAQGWDDLFLDLDPVRGIAAGERWERALYKAADRCEAVLFLVSRDWLASRWCLKELQLAQKLNKRLFGVLIDDLITAELPEELTDVWQLVRLAGGTDHRLLRATLPGGEEVHVTFSKTGLERLKAGLVKAGLDPRFFAWPPEHDPDRVPYRGLRALEAEDAGIFFGREAPIIAGLDRLRGLKDATAPRALVILGASGAGKSSYLRAGLMARLARDDRSFLPLPVIRPERAALTGESGLLRTLEQGLRDRGLAITRARLKEVVAGGADSLLPLLREVVQQGRAPALDGETSSEPPALVLAIDQAEELFQSEGAEEAAALLALLRTLALAEVPPVILLFTIRSDSFEQLQSAPALEGLALETFSLPPMPRGAYQHVIEGPALRLSESSRPLRIDAALTEQLLTDIEEGGGKDALPLLAFSLERLYVEYGGDGDLRLDEYKAIGGIEGSIEAAVEGALKAADGDPKVPADREQRLTLLRRALIPWLAGIDPASGAPRRRVARLSEIPPETQPLVRHLIEQRLLSTDVAPESGEVTVEPAHEALLRQWGLLKGWLAEDLVALTTLESVQRATRDWAANAKDGAWLAHSAGRLEDAEALLRRDDLAAMLRATERGYLAACRETETARKHRELEAARELAAAKTRAARRTLWGAIAAGILAVLAAGAAVYGLNKANEADEQAVIAEQSAEAAILNETVAFASLSRAVAADGAIAEAVMLAIAAWPRVGDMQRPQLNRTLESLAKALARHHERLRLAGHRGLLNSAVFSPDGARVLTASDDGTARLWDAATETLHLVLRGHEDPVTSAVFSPDGSRVLTASRDGTARLWDAATGAYLFMLQELDWVPVTSAVFSPDGARVLTASFDGTARLWDAATGAPLAVLQGHNIWDTRAVFSPDGARVLTASSDDTARLWDAAAGASLFLLQGHEAQITSAVFSPDGSRVLTASWDGTARLWDAATGASLFVLQGHEGWVTSAVFSPDGARVLTASSDGTARLWDAATGVSLFELRGHEGSVASAVFSPDGARALTASSDGTARLWDAATGRSLSVLQGHEGAITSAVFSPDGTRALTASDDRTARLWDAAAGVSLFTLQGHEGYVTADFSPDGARVLTASFDGTARLWDAATGASLFVLQGHEGWVTAVFSPDGARVLTDAEDGTARLWDAATGALLFVLQGHEGWVAATFSPDGARVLTASEDGTARLWDAATGASLFLLQGHEDRITGAVFSPDGARVLTASDDGTTRLWDAATGAPLFVLQGHEDRITSARFSPDGARVLTASEDDTARLWDAATGASLFVLQGHEGRITSAAFSPDGAHVLTASDDGTAHLWDAATGALLFVLQELDWRPVTAIFSPDGARVLTATDDDTAHLWDAATGASLVLQELDGGSVTAVFAPDGARVLTASFDGTARLWEVATGASLFLLQGHRDRITSAVFSPEGARVLTASDDGTARLWDISTLEEGDAFEVACQRLGNNTDVKVLAERYGLGEIEPICGEHPPLPVDPTKLQ